MSNLTKSIPAEKENAEKSIWRSFTLYAAVSRQNRELPISAIP